MTGDSQSRWWTARTFIKISSSNFIEDVLLHAPYLKLRTSLVFYSWANAPATTPQTSATF
jgi:hypothetical protein